MTIATAARSPESIVADFERCSTRYETPCGEGAMVWRVWGEGPPLVLLHGSHGSWAHWIRNIDYLASFRQIWVADLPGCGESSPPHILDDGAHVAEIVAAGMEQLLGSRLPVDVVGFSMGGVIGGHLAAMFPEKVRRLILVGVGGLDTPLGSITTVPLRGLKGDEIREAYRSNLLAIMLHHPQSVDDLALFIQMTNGPRGKIKPAPIVLPDKLLHVLPRVRAQIDVIWADTDHPHPDPEVQRDVLARFQPDLDFRVVPNSGHWVMYENADGFNTTLRSLLDQPLRVRSAAE